MQRDMFRVYDERDTPPETTMMNGFQKAVLAWMDKKNLGAVLFEGEYRFPEAFRRDALLAQRFYEKSLAS